jgi:hypothetical protein
MALTRSRWTALTYLPLAQALPGLHKVAADHFRIVDSLKAQLAKQLIGIVPVTVLISLLGLSANGWMIGWSGPCRDGRQCDCDKKADGFDNIHRAAPKYVYRFNAFNLFVTPFYLSRRIPLNFK